MDPGPAPPTSREGEDGRGREAQGGGGGTSSRHPAAAAGPCRAPHRQWGHHDDEWASQLWMENAHWALLGERHPDRSRWWAPASRRRQRPVWAPSLDGDEEGGEGEDGELEEGEIEEERTCALCQRERCEGSVTRCAREGCDNWLHCACALDRRCALRAPEGAADGFFCPDCEAPPSCHACKRPLLPPARGQDDADDPSTTEPCAACLNPTGRAAALVRAYKQRLPQALARVRAALREIIEARARDSLEAESRERLRSVVEDEAGEGTWVLGWAGLKPWLLGELNEICEDMDEDDWGGGGHVLETAKGRNLETPAPFLARAQLGLEQEDDEEEDDDENGWWENRSRTPCSSIGGDDVGFVDALAPSEPEPEPPAPVVEAPAPAEEVEALSIAEPPPPAPPTVTAVVAPSPAAQQEPEAADAAATSPLPPDDEREQPPPSPPRQTEEMEPARQPATIRRLSDYIHVQIANFAGPQGAASMSSTRRRFREPYNARVEAMKMERQQREEEAQRKEEAVAVAAADEPVVPMDVEEDEGGGGSTNNSSSTNVEEADEASRPPAPTIVSPAPAAFPAFTSVPHDSPVGPSDVVASSSSRTPPSSPELSAASSSSTTTFDSFAAAPLDRARCHGSATRVISVCASAGDGSGSDVSSSSAESSTELSSSSSSDEQEEEAAGAGAQAAAAALDVALLARIVAGDIPYEEAARAVGLPVEAAEDGSISARNKRKKGKGKATTPHLRCMLLEDAHAPATPAQAAAAAAAGPPLLTVEEQLALLEALPGAKAHAQGKAVLAALRWAKRAYPIWRTMRLAEPVVSATAGAAESEDEVSVGLAENPIEPDTLKRVVRAAAAAVGGVQPLPLDKATLEAPLKALRKAMAVLFERYEAWVASAGSLARIAKTTRTQSAEKAPWATFKRLMHDPVFKILDVPLRERLVSLELDVQKWRRAADGLIGRSKGAVVPSVAGRVADMGADPKRTGLLDSVRVYFDHTWESEDAAPVEVPWHDALGWYGRCMEWLTQVLGTSTLALASPGLVRSPQDLNLCASDFENKLLSSSPVNPDAPGPNVKDHMNRERGWGPIPAHGFRAALDRAGLGFQLIEKERADEPFDLRALAAAVPTPPLEADMVGAKDKRWRAWETYFMGAGPAIDARVTGFDRPDALAVINLHLTFASWVRRAERWRYTAALLMEGPAEVKASGLPVLPTPTPEELEAFYHMGLALGVGQDAALTATMSLLHARYGLQPTASLVDTTSVGGGVGVSQIPPGPDAELCLVSEYVPGYKILVTLRGMAAIRGAAAARLRGPSRPGTPAAAPAPAAASARSAGKGKAAVEDDDEDESLAALMAKQQRPGSRGGRVSPALGQSQAKRRAGTPPLPPGARGQAYPESSMPIAEIVAARQRAASAASVGSAMAERGGEEERKQKKRRAEEAEGEEDDEEARRERRCKRKEEKEKKRVPGALAAASTRPRAPLPASAMAAGSGLQPQQRPFQTILDRGADRSSVSCVAEGCAHPARDGTSYCSARCMAASSGRLLHAVEACKGEAALGWVGRAARAVADEDEAHGKWQAANVPELAPSPVLRNLAQFYQHERVAQPSLGPVVLPPEGQQPAPRPCHPVPPNGGGEKAQGTGPRLGPDAPFAPVPPPAEGKDAGPAAPTPLASSGSGSGTWKDKLPEGVTLWKGFGQGGLRDDNRRHLLEALFRSAQELGIGGEDTQRAAVHSALLANELEAHVYLACGAKAGGDAEKQYKRRVRQLGLALAWGESCDTEATRQALTGALLIEDLATKELKSDAVRAGEATASRSIIVTPVEGIAATNTHKGPRIVGTSSSAVAPDVEEPAAATSSAGMAAAPAPAPVPAVAAQAPAPARSAAARSTNGGRPPASSGKNGGSSASSSSSGSAAGGNGGGLRRDGSTDSANSGGGGGGSSSSSAQARGPTTGVKSLPLMPVAEARVPDGWKLLGGAKGLPFGVRNRHTAPLGSPIQTLFQIYLSDRQPPSHVPTHGPELAASNMRRVVVGMATPKPFAKTLAGLLPDCFILKEDRWWSKKDAVDHITKLVAAARARPERHFLAHVGAVPAFQEDLALKDFIKQRRKESRVARLYPVDARAVQPEAARGKLTVMVLSFEAAYELKELIPPPQQWRGMGLDALALHLLVHWRVEESDQAPATSPAEELGETDGVAAVAAGDGEAAGQAEAEEGDGIGLQSPGSEMDISGDEAPAPAAVTAAPEAAPGMPAPLPVLSPAYTPVAPQQPSPLYPLQGAPAPPAAFQTQSAVPSRASGPPAPLAYAHYQPPQQQQQEDGAALSPPPAGVDLAKVEQTLAHLLTQRSPRASLATLRADLSKPGKETAREQLSFIFPDDPAHAYFRERLNQLIEQAPAPGPATASALPPPTLQPQPAAVMPPALPVSGMGAAPLVGVMPAMHFGSGPRPPPPPRAPSSMAFKTQPPPPPRTRIGELATTTSSSSSSSSRSRRDGDRHRERGRGRSRSRSRSRERGARRSNSYEGCSSSSSRDDRKRARPDEEYGGRRQDGRGHSGSSARDSPSRSGSRPQRRRIGEEIQPAPAPAPALPPAPVPLFPGHGGFNWPSAPSQAPPPPPPRSGGRSDRERPPSRSSHSYDQWDSSRRRDDGGRRR